MCILRSQAAGRREQAAPSAAVWAARNWQDIHDPCGARELWELSSCSCSPLLESRLDYVQLVYISPHVYFTNDSVIGQAERFHMLCLLWQAFAPRYSADLNNSTLTSFFKHLVHIGIDACPLSKLFHVFRSHVLAFDVHMPLFGAKPKSSLRLSRV